MGTKSRGKYKTGRVVVLGCSSQRLKWSVGTFILQWPIQVTS